MWSGPQPVVLGRPVARERLHRRQPRALRLIFYGFLLGPARRLDAATKLGHFVFRNVDVERADLGGGLDGCAHVALPGPKCDPALPGMRTLTPRPPPGLTPSG